jgi:hypothetical protein
MNLDFHHLLPEDFSPDSRVWIYQGSRVLALSEALELEVHLNGFSADWISHGADVKAYANLFFGQFIVLMADETKTGVSGCSTDSSVRFVKQMGEKFRVDFFERTMLAFFIKDKIQLLPVSQVEYAFQNQFISADTLYFNNIITSRRELETQWIIPVKESWLWKRLAISASEL